MPLFRAGSRMVYYAHVPKCGGSAVEEYLTERFGPIGLYNKTHTAMDAAHRWSRTSPQHIDAATLAQMFPAEFFDAIFTIVRHPVARLVSAYHFQAEVERAVSPSTTFSTWLRGLDDAHRRDPFVYDNHLRPMAELVPEGADVFHLEHGLDALVPWFDALTGTEDGPRALAHTNRRGEHRKTSTGQVTPTADDLDVIRERYAVDFERFGYRVGDKAPDAEPPVLTAAALAQRDAAIAKANTPMGKLKRRIRRKLDL